MKGAEQCSLELKFPINSIGARGMQTYINAAFMGFGDETMETDTYHYNGDVQWNHDVSLLGMRVLRDGKNRLLIKDIKKKSGVEIPFEPFMSTLFNGIVTNTYAHITFISSEKNGGPAQVVMVYRYIDDPGTVNNITSVVPSLMNP